MAKRKRKKNVRTTEARWGKHVISIEEALSVRGSLNENERARTFTCLSCGGFVIAFMGGNGHPNDGGPHFEHGIGQKSVDCGKAGLPWGVGRSPTVAQGAAVVRSPDLPKS